MFNKSFLEQHLAKQINTRQSQLDHIKTNKPAFPPPHLQVQDTSEDLSTSVTGKRENFISLTKADDLEAYHDHDDVILQKVELLAKYIKDAKNCVIFTGAGVSTSAKLPDYRSKNTGILVMKERGEEVSDSANLLSDAEPTLAHKVVSALVKMGLCKYVISTNIDGLHMKSGVPFENLIELHGNCFLEYCDTCGKQYWRDFSTIKGVEDTQSKSHLTGRTCECGGNLRDAIIHFGEPLLPTELQRANEAVLKMDLALVLGSSLRVSPACNLPRKVVLPGSGSNNGIMVVVNLQKTPFEDETWLHIHDSIDNVCLHLADHLGIEH